MVIALAMPLYKTYNFWSFTGLSLLQIEQRLKIKLSGPYN